MDKEDQKASDSFIPDVRNIVIVGNTGREKTIAERIVGSAEGISSTDTGDVLRKGDVVCKPKIIDIRSEGVYCQGAVFDPNSDECFRQVHLVLFVVHHECYSDMMRNENVGDTLKDLQEYVSSISALLLVGCEGIDEAARKRTVEDFRHDPLTEEVVKLMRKGIHAVGFPNISDRKEKLREEFADEMKEDEKKLREVIGQESHPVDIREMFIKKQQQLADVTRKLQQDMYTGAGERRTASLADLARQLRRLAEKQKELTSEFQTHMERIVQQMKEQTGAIETLENQMQSTTAAKSRSSTCSIL